jgi:predicted ATPase
VLLSGATRLAAGIDDSLLTDLGEHRLKDFARAVHIFQLGTDRFPLLRTISNTNLPRPASSFIGRERDVVAIVARIRDDGARLLTLTGPGGSGKTRLVIEAAAELVGDHRAGTFWLELAPIRDPDLVIGEIAKLVGASGDVADHIGEREMLLVLDNLEQVIEAGPALATLIETCPNLRILATSRERLRVRGEVEQPVGPLAALDAVALFAARAGIPEDDDTIERLCRALDHMPLAIELAAARARVLSPAQILERLSERLDLFTGGRDADPRQRTLRATIEWSHDLLDPGERSLIARLAVFAGGCRLETATRVTDAALDRLQSLVEKSLVRQTGGRFWMYETIRVFARERLAASDEEDWIVSRHAEHFLALAEAAEPHLIREALGRVGEWTDRIDEELDDIRAATDTFESKGDGERALRITGALVWFCEERGRVAEFRRRIEWALAADLRPSPARARALAARAGLASWMGEHEVARRAAEEALAFHRAEGDTWRVADDLHSLGLVAAENEDWTVARARFEESVELFREAGDMDYELWCRRSIASTYQQTGDLVHAREIDESNLVRARQVGNRAIEGTTLGDLGTILVEEGRVPEALVFLGEAYRLHGAAHQSIEASIDIWRIAQGLAAIDRAEDAVALSSLSAALREELGASVPRVERKTRDLLDELRGRLGPVAFNDNWERGRLLDPDVAVAGAITAIMSQPAIDER